MDFITEYRSLAILLLRIFIGWLFFVQGFDAAFRIGIRNAIQSYSFEFMKKGIPLWMLYVLGYLLFVSQLVGGILLIAGIYKFLAALVLCLNLLIASIGFSLVNPVPDLKHIYPRFLLLVVLLLIPPDWDPYLFSNWL